MYTSSSSRVRRTSTFLATLLLAPVSLGVLTGEARAGSWPAEVTASYKITFNGFDLGTFRFQSRFDQDQYALDGNADISALLGAFTWQGITRTSGRLDGDAPRPGSYSFAFRSSSKTGSVVMRYEKGGVRDVKAVPEVEPSAEIVPLKEHHLNGTLDPLSAVIALSRGAAGNPCDRRLPIFDGKQRFDLTLAFRRQQRIVETRPSGQPDVGYVCSVRYQPIAGYKKSEETRRMSEATSIEVVLRPIPSAGLHVPHQITIPTIAGLAVLTAERVEIKTRNSGEIALVN